MSKVVVTGATGHIGNVLVRQLLADGHRVRVLVRAGEDATPIAGLDVEHQVGDVCDLMSLVAAFTGVELVFHLAGVIAIAPGSRALMQAVNVDGTNNVLEACRRTGVRRLIYTSSVHAFTEPAGVGAVLEETAGYDPDRATGAYGKSKAAASAAVAAASRNGLDAVLVCPVGVIGPHDYRLSELAHVAMGVARGTLPAAVNGGYDFVDVRDVARAHALAATRGTRGESYIVSGGHMRIPALMKELGALTGRRPPRVVVPLALARMAAPFAEVLDRVRGKKPLFTRYAIHTVGVRYRISDAKARRDLGHTSRPIAQSLADAVTWLRDHGHLPVISSAG